ncbi:SDR family NAD(P)-dependent oxidoreductase [Azospirillum brasilense]|uniref:SDR family NAD(P)-dependent oxidoreductase n=1 Tax=Azospirillum brasilense TaxID=192 RepID=A0A0P0F3S9_AZOBR|nr:MULTISPECIES: SDR family NAD(P)-dependent oxidoreductase [Azospirillum]ALJ35249.1 oxidoreductase [Azospirillum brasilense]MDW7555216.1 SDR family NAD(P)-dependent oxidoreductase [Azospirillum brasilense]MDW7594993.1 SDR family NAD(P)-dependent oxidoreductase [Azospirillum brasilense]MDW7629792.1 SDR family NAD(P)-dependent oxidoreductase [Azospirillum brasilense]MDX5953951.1 SDR family NAD(P)-dependent oxidoreductase [Azospirillum brasilense]
MSRLSGRTALITGASRGIGAAVAKRFAAEGAHVILAARTVGGLEETDDAIFQATGRNATLVPLDLRQFDKIDQLGYSIFERFGKLDILVSNAGVLEALGPVAHYDPKLWQRVMDVNVTANFRLIRSFDRLLRASDAGRAIFVTSGAANAPYPYWSPYGASKAALEMMVKTYAMEIASSNLRVNLIDPGIVATKLRMQAFPGEDQTKLAQPDDVTEAFVALAEASCTRHGEVVSAQG